MAANTVWVYLDFNTRTPHLDRKLWHIGNHDTVDTINDWYADYIYWEQWINIPRKDLRLALQNPDGSHVKHVAYNVQLLDILPELRNRHLVLQHSPLNPDGGESATKRIRCN